MSKNKDLTEDQQSRIVATLARIRGGLNAPKGSQFEEPAHTYVPEAHRAQSS